MVGSSRGRWLTCALVNYPWPRRRLWAPALAVAQRAAIRSGGSAISGPAGLMFHLTKLASLALVHGLAIRRVANARN